MTLPHIAALGVAAVACGYAIAQFGRGLLAGRWPSVTGEIMDARVVRLNSGDNAQALDRVVTYRYEVAGITYTSNRVRFGLEATPMTIVPAQGTNPAFSADTAATYPRGAPVRVRYNPRRPHESVLYLTPNVRVWVILAAGIYLGYAALGTGIWPLS